MAQSKCKMWSFYNLLCTEAGIRSRRSIFDARHKEVVESRLYILCTEAFVAHGVVIIAELAGTVRSLAAAGSAHAHCKQLKHKMHG